MRRWHRSAQGCVLSVALLGACSNAPRAAAPRGRAGDARPASESADREIHCSTLVHAWDAPRCVHELTAEQQTARSWSLRVRIDDGRVTQTQSVNGRGLPIDNDQRIATYVYRYDGDRVVEWEGRSQNGVVRTLTRFVGDHHEVVAWLDEQGRPRPLPGTRAIGAVRELDRWGHVTRSTYFDFHGRPASNDKGVHVVEYGHDARGAVIEERFFGADLSASTNSDGVHRVVYELDDWGEWLSRSYFGPDGQPVLSSREGFHRIRWGRDAVRNWTFMAYFDVAGNPVVSPVDRAAVAKVERNAYGSETRLDYFGVGGERVAGLWGYATRLKKLDAKEDVIEWQHLNTEGVLAPRNFGHAVLKVTRDARRNPTKDLYFDAHGGPVRTREGYAEARRRFDERDNEVRSEYFDEKSAPLLVKGGYHATNLELDGDRVVRTWFEGMDGTSVDTQHGHAEYVTNYEEGGAVAGYQYFDSAGVELKPLPKCPATFPRSVEPALVAELAKLQSCGPGDGPASVVLRLRFDGGGGAHSFVVVGPKASAATNDCLRRKLPTVALPKPPAACVIVTAELPLSPSARARVLSLGDEPEAPLPPG